jgi:flagellar hook-associated protein FlgK
MALPGISPNSSLSGMQAAAQRIQAAASNTANRQTDGFDRRGVVQSASPDGGVQARVVATGMRNDGDDAVVADAVEARDAAQAFAANTSAFRAREDALGTLLDAFA